MYYKLQAGISGGGSLPLHIDLFYEVDVSCLLSFVSLGHFHFSRTNKYVLHLQAIGIKLQNGYGLTESSPVVAARRPECNVSSKSSLGNRTSTDCFENRNHTNHSREWIKSFCIVNCIANHRTFHVIKMKKYLKI